ncbi:hypothetical protein NMY22_g8362 [Coprinellus aureogranulatus]|nr:hypothetical protein NMY22_g8362 [Coprinellus aureogranulatus]
MRALGTQAVPDTSALHGAQLFIEVRDGRREYLGKYSHPARYTAVDSSSTFSVTSPPIIAVIALSRGDFSQSGARSLSLSGWVSWRQRQQKPGIPTLDSTLMQTPSDAPQLRQSSPPLMRFERCVEGRPLTEHNGHDPPCPAQDQRSDGGIRLNHKYEVVGLGERAECDECCGQALECERFVVGASEAFAERVCQWFFAWCIRILNYNALSPLKLLKLSLISPGRYETRHFFPFLTCSRCSYVRGFQLTFAPISSDELTFCSHLDGLRHFGAATGLSSAFVAHADVQSTTLTENPQPARYELCERKWWRGVIIDPAVYPRYCLYHSKENANGSKEVREAPTLDNGCFGLSPSESSPRRLGDTCISTSRYASVITASTLFLEASIFTVVIQRPISSVCPPMCLSLAAWRSSSVDAGVSTASRGTSFPVAYLRSSIFKRSEIPAPDPTWLTTPHRRPQILVDLVSQDNKSFSRKSCRGISIKAMAVGMSIKHGYSRPLFRLIPGLGVLVTRDGLPFRFSLASVHSVPNPFLRFATRASVELTPPAHPTRSRVRRLTEAPRIPITYTDRFEVANGVNTATLLRATKKTILEAVENLGLGVNALADEQWECTICGPKKNVYKVQIDYTATAVRCTRQDGFRPVALDRAKSIPGLMTIIKRNDI